MNFQNRGGGLKLGYKTYRLIKISVDGITQINITDVQNFPLQVREKYHVNIGPYRDKVKDTQTFFYDDWKINIQPILSK